SCDSCLLGSRLRRSGRTIGDLAIRTHRASRGCAALGDETPQLEVSRERRLCERSAQAYTPTRVLGNGLRILRRAPAKLVPALRHHLFWRNAPLKKASRSHADGFATTDDFRAGLACWASHQIAAHAPKQRE